MLLGSCYDILRQKWNPWELSTLPAPGSPAVRQTPRYGAMPGGDINRTSKPDTLQDVSGSRVLQGDVIHVMKDDETGVLRDVTRVMQGDVSQAIRDDLAETKEETSLLLAGTEKTVRRKWSVLVDILLAFSVYTNGKKVLDTRQPAGSLTAIHGIRFLSMTWVILGHTYNVSISILGSTPTTVLLEHIKRWTFDAVFNASVSVDTFFTLSGLLVAYLTCKEIFKKGWKINWPLFYFHRFWRLTPPYMLTILLVLGLQRFMGSGSLWPMQMPVDKTFCENNWWTNLLYINNIVHNDEMCLEQSWYLANDMQFYVLSPLMLIPFYFHAYAGLASCLVFLLAQWITTGILATQNDWTATPLLNVPAKPGALNWQLYYYFAPYCRIGPYVVGIIVGYFLAVSNGKIKMRKYVVCIGWALATAVALAVLYGLRGDISGDHYSSVGVAALYLALARSAWGASVAWVVVACASGYGGPVNAILSWPPFVVLGRLTYMAYLIHPCLMIAYFANMESPYYTIDTSIAISFLGILVVVNMASFVLMLALESPMISLEKIFLGKTKKNA
ncbi:nose resistant to fluoxetine protein 6-like isoform X2 [Physella acuta]|uniref:nose resistant to fluoxetine protein 6-like isoform X1 n=1 Tax=Physella acuta TaxID=109671 RepID=UPI0027DC9EB8|nr:nose resistant to fluoxetine protein 6-like isoform X1 [Physella acuta]XP_059140227.1 nose resistant to fluoxetine protein 6-like isoform X2 [Physella acuta]